MDKRGRGDSFFPTLILPRRNIRSSRPGTKDTVLFIETTRQEQRSTGRDKNINLNNLKRKDNNDTTNIEGDDGVALVQPGCVWRYF